MISTIEAAKLLGVSYNTIINYTERPVDPLPCVVKPQGLRQTREFDRDILIKWAQRNGIAVQTD